jgi:lipid-binding SYLF domain-containing protein
MRATCLWLAVLAFGIALSATSVFAAGLQDDVNQAATIIERFQAVPEKGIPRSALKDARGVAILTVIKAGFGVSGRGGTGIVVARTAKGWSGPSGIGTGGAGFGLQIGAQVTEFVIILNTDAAVKVFAQDANVQLGGGLSVAAGPIGRNVEAGCYRSLRSTPTAAVKDCLPASPWKGQLLAQETTPMPRITADL